MDARIGNAAEPLFDGKSLRRLFVPILIEQILAATIGVADTVMVASLDMQSMSAVSLVDNINILLIQILSALATGGAVVAAQYVGRGSREQAAESAKQLYYATILVSTLIAAASIAFNRPLLTLIFGSVEPKIMDGACTYFLLSALSYPFVALYNAGSSVFRAMGNSRVSMFTSLLMNVINVFGNALGIYGLGWGVAGAGAASLLARAAGALYVTWLLTRPSSPIRIRQLWKVKLNLAEIKRILRIGVPNGFENGLFQIGKLLVAGLVSTLGTAAIAANAAANSVTSFINLPGCAMSLTILTVAGQCAGAGEYEQASANTKRLLAWAHVMMAITGALTLVFMDSFVGLFHLNAEAAASATWILRAFCVMTMFFWPESFALPNAIRAAGDVRYTMIVSALSCWLVRIGVSYLLCYGFGVGVECVWLGMWGDWLARDAAFIWRFRSGKWKTKRVIG